MSAFAHTLEHVALTEREAAILAVERQWWRYQGMKEQRIRETLAISATRYYQLLNALIDRADALEADPMTVTRLRRLREQRHARRSPRTTRDRPDDK